MELTEKGALDLSAMLERREIGAAELMQATLDRIAAVNPAVNAVVSLGDPDDLLAAARKADDTPRQGWLHGIPMAVKDLANVAGFPTSFGSPAMPTAPAKSDDLMVARMRAAGAVFIGKTNTPEFGLGSHTFNPVHGTTLNPYDAGRSAGGSSGGAAAALAAGMVSVADGSDMMGSLRNPAGWNNVYGMRPSWGRVPGEPLGEMFLHPLATSGPMARNPRDLAALLDVQAGPDPRQPFCLPQESFLDRIAAQVGGRRIGWLGDWGGAYEMEPGILELSGRAARVFEDLGAIVEPVAPPIEAAQLWEAWLGLRAFANAGRLDPLYQNPATRARLKPDAVWEIETGRALTAPEIQRLSLIRSEWYRRAAALFDSYDALVLPSAQVWPFPADWERPHRINDTEMDTYHRWMEVVVPVSLIGLPCVNLPAGFGANGLPGGVQLFGRHGNDLGLLQLAEAYHQATDWPGKRPPPLS
ncbi:amidase [Lutimaribacter pacificus]|uniref:Amidase n=1 Tax=Lutimaribacter pacificus TaxID=391948 RepID=A0A1H0AGV7_9RHOB|nr:amidase [Lutimaribacter pacificus]SDN32665.1 amidase [Lutimaribacter pacificus]SHJ69411.1 amidase [Lutimaribacter pacificus]